MKQVIGAFLALAVITGTAQAQAPAAPAPKVVATVNGEKLTEDELVRTLMARYGNRTLNALISNLAIRQAAKAAGVTVTKQELEERMQSTQRAIDVRAPLTGDTFERWLAKQGLTADYFMAEVYDQMLIDKMVEGQVKVSPETIASFYQRNKDQLTEPAQVRVAHICVQDKKQAEIILTQILDKKITWAEAAKKYSLDPWTRDNGGDMGFITLADTEFHRAAFVLKKDGDIAPDPVMTSMGYHLIKRLEFKAPYIPRFEEIEKTIKEQLEHSQLRLLTTAKREEILKAAKLDIKLEIQREPAPPFTGGAAPAPAATTPAPAPAPTQ
jgi:foldase protein PrsA